MVATKLNPSAPPFPRPCHLGPAAAPPSMLPYGATACPPPPFGAVYFCAAQFPVVPSPHHHHHHHHHHHPFVQFPVLCKTTAGPAPFLRKGGTGKKPPRRVLRKAVVVPKQTPRASRKVAPPLPPTTTKTKGTCRETVVVPAAPADDKRDDLLPEHVGEPAPHGLPPHKLMMVQRKAAGDDVSTAREQEEPAPDAAAAAAGQEKPAGRASRRKAERKWRGRNARKPSRARDGAVVGPRAAGRTFRSPRAWMAWTPPTSAFTTQRKEPLPDEPPAYLGFCTTVMVRNIPNRLKCDEMIALLDQHCARANRLAGAVVAAYDVFYLPMDFRRQGNYGYAFVNFTTADAAVGLYYTLQGCGWKVCGSTKTIDIVPANIQGKAELVRHFNRHKFECENVDYLPAVFTPPRDGGAQATVTTTTRVGKLAPVPCPPRPASFVKTRKAYAPVVRPKVQG